VDCRPSHQISARAKWLVMQRPEPGCENVEFRKTRIVRPPSQGLAIIAFNTISEQMPDRDQLHGKVFSSVRRVRPTHTSRYLILHYDK